jgi:hypothetical protein
LDDYRFALDDPRVYQISWNDYFAFGTMPARKDFDAEFMTPALLASLFEIDPALVREGFTPGNLKDFLDSIGISEAAYKGIFAKGPVIAMRCRGSYTYREGSYAFHFDYIGKRIERFGIEND